MPAQFTFGDLGRDTLRSDWYRNLDFSVFKVFPVTESKRFEFRAEIFNITNAEVLSIPISSLESPDFGQVTSTVTQPRANSARPKVLLLTAVVKPAKQERTVAIFANSDLKTGGADRERDQEARGQHSIERLPWDSHPISTSRNFPSPCFPINPTAGSFSLLAAAQFGFYARFF